jgi:hypothetical protein
VKFFGWARSAAETQVRQKNSATFLIIRWLKDETFHALQKHPLRINDLSHGDFKAGEKFKIVRRKWSASAKPGGMFRVEG